MAAPNLINASGLCAGLRPSPIPRRVNLRSFCLLYTSDAADERSSVDLGGRRIIKKKRTTEYGRRGTMQQENETHYNKEEQNTIHITKKERDARA
mgnify:CR=1 FL=1